MSNRSHPWLEDSHHGGVAWTADEVRVLQDLHASHTARQIAVLLGRSKPSVTHKLAALKLSGRAYHEQPSSTLREEIEAARREWATAPAYRPGDRDV